MNEFGSEIGEATLKEQECETDEEDFSVKGSSSTKHDICLS